MIAGLATHWIATTKADLAALWSCWRSRRGPWPTAWRHTAELARHRQIVVSTPPGAQPVLRTRIRLSGETETCVLRAWLGAASRTEVEAMAESHFAAVAAAAGGWPAAHGMVRLGSRAAAIGGSAMAVWKAIQGLLNHGAADFLHRPLTYWPLFVALLVLFVGLGARRILRWWLNAMIHRMPHRVPHPAPSA